MLPDLTGEHSNQNSQLFFSGVGRDQNRAKRRVNNGLCMTAGCVNTRKLFAKTSAITTLGADNLSDIVFSACYTATV